MALPKLKFSKALLFRMNGNLARIAVVIFMLMVRVFLLKQT